MFGGHSRKMETSSHDALRKKFALVRSVTSLTGAFAGNFVDFQSDFFYTSSLGGHLSKLLQCVPYAQCPIAKVTLTELGIFAAYGYTCLR